MDWFESKKAILEYCWKDGKDVRWLDRAIKDGKIWICDGAYYVVSEYVKDLEKDCTELECENVELHKKIEELEKSDTKFVSKAMWEKVLNEGEIKRLEDENKELKQRLMYVWARLDHVNGCLNTIREKFANSNAKWSTEKFNSEFGYKMDERENEERSRAEEHWLII